MNITPTPYQTVVLHQSFELCSEDAALTFHDFSEREHDHRAIMIGDLFDTGNPFIKLFQADAETQRFETINFELHPDQVRLLRDYLTTVMER